MGSSVSKLDRSGWSAEALARAEWYDAQKAAVKGYAAAKAAHPFARALDGLDDASAAASAAPRWVGTEKRFGNGVCRLTIKRICPDPEAQLERAIKRDLRMPTGLEVEPTDEDRAAWRKRNARRAKSTVVDKAISAGMNSLHTLTFRENVTDLDEALRCFDLYRRKCQRLLKGWRYVVCWQRQARGAWHFHLATYRLPRYITEAGVKINSWDVMRKLWRQCAGSYGGNFDEVRQKRRNGANMPLKRAGQIARYIGRYIGRDIGEGSEESLAGRKSFATSKGIDRPVPLRYLWDGEDRWSDLLQWAFQHMPSEHRSYWFSPDLQVFFIECDPTGQATVAPS